MCEYGCRICCSGVVAALKGSTRSVVWLILAPEKRAAISADFLRDMMFSWSPAEVTTGREELRSGAKYFRKLFMNSVAITHLYT